MSALFALALLLPTLAFAQQTQPGAPRPASPPPRPVVIRQPDPNYQRTVQQQQVQNQLQKNAMQEQLRQNNANQLRSATADPALRSQQDNADAAAQRQHDARQQAVINRYRSMPVPADTETLRQTKAPAPSSSGGK
jgi:hypothetical protein